jgi:hypothetical protein
MQEFDLIEINTLKDALRFYIDSENYDHIEKLNEFIDLYNKLERIGHEVWLKEHQKRSGPITRPEN